MIIPARYASTRLPGKPLIELGGKPMILRVLEVAAQAGAAFSIVATDDARIADVVTQAGGEAMLTSPDHATGTDRLAEVVRRKQLDPELVVVNLQGDEPNLPAHLVKCAAQALLESPAAHLATLATPVRERREVFDPNIVKVVTNQTGQALYFSRAPIPWLRGAFTIEGGSRPSAELPEGPFLRHIGVYAYRVATLLRLSDATPVALERAESLEQLRALWLGMTIQVAIVAEPPAAGVDTAEDVARLSKLYTG
ncbi:MAG TPA: 3-deoxy-manno-octulosonate cytidylyltransferase [Polyangiaceae bacterium]|nr:3-deoxy-manno-octulosonate cytidylyltransferase [Polyangiaceae bacterium]